MSKWYEVPVTILKTLAVEIDDEETEEDAKRYVLEELCFEPDVTINDVVPVGSDKSSIQTLKACADEVISI